ncbi:MAG: hypothetical protein Q8R55_03000 [Candidatus Taylorbacteria bacterium]|nr:hypothetical protein [Candidatus Taylorbacteria bacterium]
MNAREIIDLLDSGAVLECHNIFLTKVIFRPSMSREAIINAVISLTLTSDYDCHEIETLPDGSIRLTVHLDS